MGNWCYFMSPSVEIVAQQLLARAVAGVDDEAVTAAARRNPVLTDGEEAHELGHAPIQLLEVGGVALLVGDATLIRPAGHARNQEVSDLVHGTVRALPEGGREAAITQRWHRVMRQVRPAMLIALGVGLLKLIEVIAPVDGHQVRAALLSRDEEIPA